MSKIPKLANHVTIEACHCGCRQVYIYLHNAKGRAFACAPFDKDDVRVVAADITAAADELTIGGEVVGHA